MLLSCPSKRRSSAPLSMSQSRSVLSLEAEMTRRASSTATELTPSPCPSRRCSSAPVSKSQIRRVLSFEAEMTRRPSSTATALTLSPCPSRQRSCDPVSRSHSRTVLSLWPHETTREPSSLVKCATQPLCCVLKASTSSPVSISQSVSAPTQSPVRILRSPSTMKLETHRSRPLYRVSFSFASKFHRRMVRSSDAESTCNRSSTATLVTLLEWPPKLRSFSPLSTSQISTSQNPAVATTRRRLSSVVRLSAQNRTPSNLRSSCTVSLS